VRYANVGCDGGRAVFVTSELRVASCEVRGRFGDPRYPFPEGKRRPRMVWSGLGSRNRGNRLLLLPRGTHPLVLH
jgi:hypothetical protein